MPDPVTQSAAPAIGGLLSSILVVTFGIDFHSFVFAFIGSWIGAAMLVSISFLRTLLMIVTGTIASSALIPIVLKTWPEYSQVSLSFIVGFLVVYFHKLVLKLLAAALERVLGKIGA